QVHLANSFGLSQAEVSRAENGCVGIAKRSALGLMEDFLTQHASEVLLGGIVSGDQYLLCNRFGDDQRCRLAGQTGFYDQFRDQAEATMRQQLGKRTDNYR